MQLYTEAWGAAIQVKGNKYEHNKDEDCIEKPKKKG